MLGSGLLFAASTALAVDPSIKCETDKLRLAAKYTACRLAADAEAARDFTTPTFDKCENTYLLAWAKAEEHARAKGAPCWTEGDAMVVKGDIDAHTGSLAASLSGGK
ncbi:MAG TPA: hypothetical protein VL049_01725 [Candidatus Dormibacteraeota bacterium]|nr:hypothetical protein [Candidatus Dormibacteraeota bacterium]